MEPLFSSFIRDPLPFSPTTLLRTSNLLTSLNSSEHQREDPLTRSRGVASNNRKDILCTENEVELEIDYFQ